jgi:hypothetical protein
MWTDADCNARKADADTEMVAGERGRRKCEAGHDEQAQNHRTKTTLAECHDCTPDTQLDDWNVAASYCDLWAESLLKPSA